jgi:uncharacterized protein
MLTEVLVKACTCANAAAGAISRQVNAADRYCLNSFRGLCIEASHAHGIVRFDCVESGLLRGEAYLIPSNNAVASLHELALNHQCFLSVLTARQHPVSSLESSAVFCLLRGARRPDHSAHNRTLFAGTAMTIVRFARVVLFASLLFSHAAARATSFDCNKGRSIPEQLICHTVDLSKLDDQLGKLYWQARRRIDNPKAFRADSDSKWAWREANCHDEACLKTWYSGRIEELQQLLASLPTGARAAPASVSLTPDTAGTAGTAGASEPAVPSLRALPVDVGRRALAGVSEPTGPLQCTAAEPGIDLREQCSTVLKQDARWQYPPRPGDWFCGVATLAQTPAATPAQ